MSEPPSRPRGEPEPAPASVPRHAAPPPGEPEPPASGLDGEPDAGAPSANGPGPGAAAGEPVADEAPPDATAATPAADEPPAAAPPATRTRRGLNPFVELILILGVAFGLAYVVQGWVVKPYRIPSVSMEPTLHVGDMVLVNRFVYRLHGPRRGDIVVFHPPGLGQTPERNARTEASVNFIKRVIGLPGETVQVKHGSVLICRAPHVGCRALVEPYVKSHNYSDYGPFRVPPGDYFVMGDNRVNSDDSRVWGPLPRHNIIGEAFLVYWPLDRIGTL
jgi:signal peptidase I